MYGDQFGGRSFTTIYKREQDKLANSFEAATNLVAGQPVSLNADGKIEALTKENAAGYLGINLYTVKEGTLTTVMVLSSHVMVYCKAKTALTVGTRVKIEAVEANTKVEDTTIDYVPHLEASTAATGDVAMGICLDTAEMGEIEVRVLVLDNPVAI